MPILKAIQPTFLKRDPVKQAVDLLPEGKYFLSVNTMLALTTTPPLVNQYFQLTLKQPIHGVVTWFAFAPHVQVLAESNPALEMARDRQTIFNTCFAAATQPGFDQNRLTFLDRGIQNSALNGQIGSYPSRLQQTPKAQTLSSLGDQVVLVGSQQRVDFSPYPNVGVMPTLDQNGLSFLHPDIQEACLCVGSYTKGQMQAHWLGRNALTKGQFWSATKILPILNVVWQANVKSSTTPIKSCVIRDAQRLANQPGTDLDFTETAIDIISYRKDNVVQEIMISNQLADTLKRLSTLSDLESWLANITGNHQLEFRGYYSDNPLIANPCLQSGETVILRSPAAGKPGENLITAYDLTRILSMVGWHVNLPIAARLPAIQWHSLETLVRCLGYDSARYVDVALKTLGLTDSLSGVVVLSKLGFGDSDTRQRTELCYTALVQFTDDRPKANQQPAKLRTLALTLRAAVQKKDSKGERDLDAEARWLDARMAAEVTEILRRIVTEELA